MEKTLNETVDSVVRRGRTLLSGQPAAYGSAEGGETVAVSSDRDGEASRHRGDKTPGYLPDLLRLVEHLEKVASTKCDPTTPPGEPSLNPTLHVVSVGWKHLPALLNGAGEKSPERGIECILIWRHPEKEKLLLRTASPDELLIVKVMAEGLSLKSIAEEHNVPRTALSRLFRYAAEEGLLILPPSRIKRPYVHASVPVSADDHFLMAETFTLQWHITQACDLHCRHCYDRSSRSHMEMEQATRVLDDLHTFVSGRNVVGHVTFTGGNPLLFPDFLRLYAATVERGFETSILGNPATRQQVHDLVKIQPPNLYQISLEGLQDHNDAIRGTGHFKTALEFLDVLREEGVHAMVMLTLTRDNIDQVIPLTRMLRDCADTFHFNRLSPVGEGANLMLPDKETYTAFLESYLTECLSNPILGLKDNLINIIRHRRGEPLFGGCTGFGCGAAFNFLAVLPDGEVHACRKFSSPIGNIFSHELETIYSSGEAERYRSGCGACADCAIRPVCGGCLAMTSGHGGDFSRDKDPFCFIGDTGTAF